MEAPRGMGLMSWTETTSPWGGVWPPPLLARPAHVIPPIPPPPTHTLPKAPLPKASLPKARKVTRLPKRKVKLTRRGGVSKHVSWSPEEEAKLERLASTAEVVPAVWARIAAQIPDRSAEACYSRFKKIMPSKNPGLYERLNSIGNSAHPRRWTPSEDAKLLKMAEKHSYEWGAVALEFTSASRGHRGCRDRLRPLEGKRAAAKRERAAKSHTPKAKKS